MGSPPCPSPCPLSASSWPELDVFAWSLPDALPWSVLAWSVLLWSASPLARLLDNSSNTERQTANRQVIAMVKRKCKRKIWIKLKKKTSGRLKCNSQPQTWFMSFISVQYVHISALSPLSPLTHGSHRQVRPSPGQPILRSPPTLYPDQLVWPLNSLEVLMLSFHPHQKLVGAN